MFVTIRDSFDLKKIADSGQCFRVREFPDGRFRFITGQNVLYIKKEGDDLYSVSCTEDAWNSVWCDYFDLNRDYSCIERTIPANDAFLQQAYAEGKGIRILRQDHWETLISFIISQRKSIPAIKQSVELLSAAYGTPIATPYETVYSFPTPAALKNISLAELKNFKVGYRDKYLMSAIEKVSDGSICLNALEGLPDPELFDALCRIQGVGRKVANCICLFSYGRTGFAPVDTWIRKVIDTYYDGIDPFPSFGTNAGILQQYVFHYSIHNKGNFSIVRVP